MCVALCALALTACSKTEKVVRWEEEVLLNTGETIWVNRTDTFVKSSEPGNPLMMAWRLDRRAYEFSCQGQKYTFQTDAHVSDVLMIHAVDVPKGIAIVAWNLDCAKRGYSEFRWNNRWQLQQTVDTALIGQPSNVMDATVDVVGDIPQRATFGYKRNAHFELPQNGEAETHLLASRIATNCTGNK